MSVDEIGIIIELSLTEVLKRHNVMPPLHQKRKGGGGSVYLRVLLFRNHDDSFLSQYCFSSPPVQIL